MTIQMLTNLSNIVLVIAIILVVIAIVLYFRLDINRAWHLVTGRQIKEKKKKKGLFYVLTHRGNGKKSGVLILALFLTIIMAGTATYAWFTANKTVTVNDITVNIAAKNGIQISVNGSNWQSTLTTEELKRQGNVLLDVHLKME